MPRPLTGCDNPRIWRTLTHISFVRQSCTFWFLPLSSQRVRGFPSLFASRWCCLFSPLCERWPDIFPSVRVKAPRLSSLFVNGALASAPPAWTLSLSVAIYVTGDPVSSPSVWTSSSSELGVKYQRWSSANLKANFKALWLIWLDKKTSETVFLLCCYRSDHEEPLCLYIIFEVKQRNCIGIFCRANGEGPNDHHRI